MKNKHKRISRKENTTLFIVLVLIVGVIAGVYLVLNSTNFLPKTSSPYQNTSNQTINNSSDLNKALNELESTDINQIDQGLSENSSDASSF